MLSREEIIKIAKLARIELSEQEVEKFQKELSTVLDYVEELKKVNTQDVRLGSTSLDESKRAESRRVGEVFEVTGLQNIQREDKVEAAENREEILGQAPEIKDGFYKVKAIL